jgi:phage terminase large subunit
MLAYQKKEVTLSQSLGTFQTSMRSVVQTDPLIDFVKGFRNDIYAYCDVLKFSPNWQQKELLDAYQEGEPRIACRAGKGPGKTKATAVVLSHWSLVHPKSMLIVTAPTFRQCKDVWLAELYSTVTSAQADPKLQTYFTFRGSGFGILGAKNAEWGCQLVTALKKEAFQGMHKLYLGFLEEEASGVQEEISNAIQETISNAKGHFIHIRIGNPNSRLTKFFDSFHKESHKWHCLHWNTEQTPETPYFSKRRNDEIADEFGKNSDIYRISVLGEFPNLDPNCLISEEDLEACCTPETLHRAMHENPDRAKQIGLDLARYGGDECVAVWRKGGVLYDMWAEKTDPNNAVDKAIAGQMFYEWEDDECTYVVDTSGMGEGVVGNMGGANRMGKTVHEFYSQNTAVESNKYHDKISEAWCHFAKLVHKHQVYLGEKLDKKLKNQLTTRRYTVTPKGLIKIESKDDYKKNNKDSENGTIGKSPDRADGVVMAFYPHASASLRIATGG